MDIPSYPERRPVELQDKELLDGLLRPLEPRISEFTFANLYLFRHAHAYALTAVHDVPVILGCGYGKESYFFPPLVADPASACISLLNEGLTLYGADDRFRASFLSDESFDVSEDRDNFDYLYLRQELAELAGGKFHKKKNRLNYLLRRHEVAAEPFDDRHLDEAFNVLKEWEKVRAQAGSRSVSFEVEAAGEALRRRKELGLKGIAAVVDGKVAGFSLGERLNAETAVCHFEKADPFFEGLPQYLNREFCALLFTECRYVNREQDLGEGGLREAKLSYHPVELVRKYRVRLRKQ